MIYYLKKTLTHKNSKRVLIIEKDDIASIPANSILVLVDDFAGTGKSIEDFYNNISPRLPSIHSKYALTVAFLERAEKKLAALDIVTIGNKRLPAFSARGSVFGYPPRMKALREFCFIKGIASALNFNKLQKYTSNVHQIQETAQNSLTSQAI